MEIKISEVREGYRKWKVLTPLPPPLPPSLHTPSPGTADTQYLDL